MHAHTYTHTHTYTFQAFYIHACIEMRSVPWPTCTHVDTHTHKQTNEKCDLHVHTYMHTSYLCTCMHTKKKSEGITRKLIYKTPHHQIQWKQLKVARVHKQIIMLHVFSKNKKKNSLLCYMYLAKTKMQIIMLHIFSIYYRVYSQVFRG